MSIQAKFSIALMFLALTALLLPACGGSGSDPAAYVKIKNGFGEMPPWTICQSYYQGTPFGEIKIGATTEELEVEPGLGYVLMVAAWDDPDCNPENCLPIATKNEEEVVDDQHREITVEMANHQGPCPPEGVQPIPEEQYNKILELWPDYGFKPYAQRTENTECL
ncbi:MAG: hypothetical protein C4523_18285 [Myxococcales bacterium]|nr:MAG: hypothetical protein C4523_18285 [Myxococcales bacterium]